MDAYIQKLRLQKLRKNIPSADQRSTRSDTICRRHSFYELDDQDLEARNIAKRPVDLGLSKAEVTRFQTSYPVKWMRSSPKWITPVITCCGRGPDLCPQ